VSARRSRRPPGRQPTSEKGPSDRDSPSSPERVGEALSRVLDKLGVAKEVASQSAVPRWADTVGEKIAGVTRAKAVAGGVLFVEVRSSAWLNELNLMRREILGRLNAGQRDARIERIVFTLSEGGSGMERTAQDR
jgi:predicted nucleic acid-binding Zn ribbon protein